MPNQDRDEITAGAGLDLTIGQITKLIIEAQATGEDETRCLIAEAERAVAEQTPLLRQGLYKAVVME